MASFQVPQFLDSGDKILGPLNIRQFGYALGGFLLAFLIYSILSPFVGIFAAVPALPVVAITAFIAFGRYNGRDSEIYILKFILFTKKARKLVYKRQPDVRKLNQRLSQLTPEKITTEWNKRLHEKQQGRKKLFSDISAEEKITRIKKLGQAIDKTMTSGTSIVKDMEKQKFLHENKLVKYNQNQKRHQFISKTDEKQNKFSTPAKTGTKRLF